MAKKGWLTILTISLISGIFLIYGAVQAFQVTVHSSKQVLLNEDEGNQEMIPSKLVVPKKLDGNEEAIQIVVIGDSIARGTGDVTGKGVTDGLENYFVNRGQDTLITNIAVDGLKSIELKEQLTDGTIPDLISSADIIVLSIGGNDMQALVGGEESLLDFSLFGETQAEYLNHLQQIIETIRGYNPNSYILFIGLYDPIDDDLLDMLSTSPDIEYLENLQEWNYQTQKVIDQDPFGLFVPTYDLFKWNLNKYISYDRFHPSSEGYRAISDRLVQYFSSAILQENEYN